MHRTGVLTPQFIAQLPQRLDKRQSFDIADGPANLTQHEIVVIDIGLREFLDRIGDVRDDLHGRPKIVPAPLADDNIAVNPARGDVVRLPCRNAGEALVMPQIKVSFGAIVSDVNFAVLIRAHRPGIDVQIGIELANPDLVTARLQQCRQACRHQTFAKRGDHAAGNKNEPRHGS